MHYSRVLRGSDLFKEPKIENKGSKCFVDNCDNPAFSKLLCRFHYQRKRNGTPLDALKAQGVDYKPRTDSCSVYACTNKRIARGLCSLHWQRAKAGVPLDLPENFKTILAKGWHSIPNEYKMISTKDGDRPEHRILVEKVLGRRLNQDEVVHHKDRNKKNNSLSNLQVMTRSEHTALHNREDKVGKKIKRIYTHVTKMLSLPWS